VRSPNTFYGAGTVALHADAFSNSAPIAAADLADLIGSIYATAMDPLLVSPSPSATNKTASFIKVSLQTEKLPAADVHRIYQAITHAATTVVGTSSTGVSLMRHLAAADAARAAAMRSFGAISDQPGVLLGEAWPHHIRLSSDDERGADARSGRFSAADFSDLLEVDRGAIDRVVACLNLLPTSIPRPQASPSPDGEIGLFWFHNGNRVEAYFDPEGHLTWIGKFDGRFDRGGDVEWNGLLPDAFVRMLTHL
jgi:hypothetical protein